MKIFSAFLISIALSCAPAMAAEVPYDKAQFDKTMAEGKPIVVDFHADWCPTCRMQKPAVKALAADPKFAGVTIFIADYDKEKELKKQINVSKQATFVVFKNGQEVTRSTGETNQYAIGTVFAKALD